MFGNVNEFSNNSVNACNENSCIMSFISVLPSNIFMLRYYQAFIVGVDRVYS